MAFTPNFQREKNKFWSIAGLDLRTVLRLIAGGIQLSSVFHAVGDPTQHILSW